MKEKYINSQIPWTSILDLCSNEIYIFEIDGNIIYSNETARQESGYDYKEEKVSILDVFPKYFGMSNHKIVILDKGNKEQEREVFAYRKNQTCYPVQLKFSWEVSGESRIGVLIASNITELKAALKREKVIHGELDDANSVKNMFLANITHELRTPVNGMRGLADVLMETKLDDKQRESVDIIRRCCENMSNLINDILDFTKITAKKLELAEAEFDFSKFMKNIVGVHMTMLNQKGLKLQINIGEDVPEIIYGDELRLGQILNNLISNAIKFTMTGSVAVEVVNTFEDEEQLELFFIVIDSGIGIAKEEMDKLFLSFSQVDQSITRKFGGTGLGLVISKKLIELMGGSIYVDSEKGKGSTFSFSARFKKNKNQEEVEKFENKGEARCGQTSMEMKVIESALSDQVKIIDVKGIQRNIERLGVCLELGIWEKAENYAGVIKHMVPDSFVELKKQAFRIELAVRKEDYSQAIKQLEIYSQMM